MDKEQEISLLRITAQYIAEVQAGRQPNLSDYLARYPHYADAIADFVAYYHAVEEVLPSMDAEPLIGTMPSKGVEASAETMTSLLTTAMGQKISLSQIADELDLSVDIVLLLEQRAIAPITIPYELYENIAVLLQQPTALVKEYLYSLDQPKSQFAVKKEKQQMKIAEEGVSYSIPETLDKPSFRAIMETSLQLSAEQRGHWRTILDAERL